MGYNYHLILNLDPLVDSRAILLTNFSSTQWWARADLFLSALCDSHPQLTTVQHMSPVLMSSTITIMCCWRSERDQYKVKARSFPLPRKWYCSSPLEEALVKHRKITIWPSNLFKDTAALATCPPLFLQHEIIRCWGHRTLHHCLR